MFDNSLRKLAVVPARAKRGRPSGAAKSDRDRIRDRIRTVATMNALLIRTTCADNSNQFARWFDETMRGRHPFLAWETERSRKWRKNFAGDVALIRESVDHLQELFPDERYYSIVEYARRGREVVPAYPDRGSAGPVIVVQTAGALSARKLFDDGPGKLWQALWGYEHDLLGLWDLYPGEGEGITWGKGEEFSDVLGDLEMKLWSDSRCGVPIEVQDLGRAIALYRLQYEGYGGASQDGISAYLCLRLAMAELSPWLRALDVWDDLSTYVVDLELDRLRLYDEYRALLEELHFGDQSFDAVAYAVNPFLFMSSDVPWLADHLGRLAALSSYSLKSI